MEFRDLKQQYKVLKEKMDRAFIAVAGEGNYISGRQVKELEQQLSSYTGRKHCISCANGTDALSMVLMAWGIKEGDAVFVPDFTFFATGEVAAFEGAAPVFVDVDPNTFNMSPEKLELAIIKTLQEGRYTPKVIIPADLFGLPADCVQIERIADKYNLLLLEDGAQGFGGRIGTRAACSFGQASTTSFFPAKPLGCYGDGGAIFTDDDTLAALLESIKVHGRGGNKYDNIRIGINSRLDTLQAAILQVKLDAFAGYELEKINQAAALYTQLLQGAVKTPVIPEGFYSSWAQYTVVLNNQAQRQRIQNALKEKGIPTMVYYPKPMHRQQAFTDLCYVQDDFPVTDRLCQTVLSLPMHPYLTKEDIIFVCNEFIKSL